MYRTLVCSLMAAALGMGGALCFRMKTALVRDERIVATPPVDDKAAALMAARNHLALSWRADQLTSGNWAVELHGNEARITFLLAAAPEFPINVYEVKSGSEWMIDHEDDCRSC